MEKVKLTKDSHVGKKGEVKYLPSLRANYLIRVGLAVQIEEKPKPAADIEKKAIKKDTPTKRTDKKTI